MPKTSKRGKATEQYKKKVKGIKMLKSGDKQARITRMLDVSLPAVKKWSQYLNAAEGNMQKLMEEDPQRGPKRKK